jgi:hypothetical protein
MPKFGSNLYKIKSKKQIPKKVLKEMCNYFLKKSEEWYYSIKKKNLHVRQIYEQYRE